MICDEYGMIKDVDLEFSKILEYEHNELNGKFMGVMMSPFLSFFHKNYLLPMFRAM